MHFHHNDIVLADVMVAPRGVVLPTGLRYFSAKWDCYIYGALWATVTAVMAVGEFP